MRLTTIEELKEILKKHRLWLEGNGGDRADLSGAILRGADLSSADLSGAILRGADLSGAILRGANLYGANLSGANLYGANLYGADLSGAILCGANLYGANLYGADLSGAILCGANLYGANLSGANLYGANLYGADLSGAILCGAILDSINLPFACPEKGSFVGFKKCIDNKIVELEILSDSKRSSATTRKCRCSKARVISITDIDGSTTYEEAVSWYNSKFKYRVGKTVVADNFDEDRWNECSTGIHFFITRQEAVDYSI